MPTTHHRRPLLLHAARTALAAAATLALTEFAGLAHGYWAVISAIIVMQSNVGGSIRAGLRRVAGTALGALVGMCFLLLGEPGVGLLGLAVFLTLALSALTTRGQQTFRMAGVSAAIVLLAWPGQGSPVWFAVERFGEIFIGVAVALAVSLLLWPSHAARRLADELAAELEGLADWSTLAVARFLGHTEGGDQDRSEQLHRRLAATRDLHDQTMQEAALLRIHATRLMACAGSVERLFGLVRGLSRMAETANPHGYQQRLAAEVEELGRECAAAMRIIARRIGPGEEPGASTRLPVAVENLEDRLLELRREQATAPFELMEVAEVFAFVQSLKALAVELEWLALTLRPRS